MPVRSKHKFGWCRHVGFWAWLLFGCLVLSEFWLANVIWTTSIGTDSLEADSGSVDAVHKRLHAGVSEQKNHLANVYDDVEPLTTFSDQKPLLPDVQTDALRAVDPSPKTWQGGLPILQGYSKYSGYLSDFAAGDSKERDPRESKTRCDLLALCSGFTCSSSNKCTVRSGKEVLASGSGEMSYSKSGTVTADKDVVASDSGEVSHAKGGAHIAQPEASPQTINFAHADPWTSLQTKKFEIEYMGRRILERKEAWMHAFKVLDPPWQQEKQETRLKALIWPQACYLHFGVKRIWSLGEYSQWADLVAALATLGIMAELWPGGNKKYPQQHDYDAVDIVFTDYQGIHEGWRKTVRPPPDKTWILDTFGTDGTVVDHDFYGRKPILTDYPLHRILTLVPGYSERNNFLGVALPRPPAWDPKPRVWRCVLWCKVHPWLGWKTPFFRDAVREYAKHCPVVATVDKEDTFKSSKLLQDCCPEVKQLGVLSPTGFQDLLRTSAVYVGIGEPLIAPSGFEALSMGAHVVQPKFRTPKVIEGKPITKGWTSQHPLLEQIPEPYAFSLDLENQQAVTRAFEKIRRAFDAGGAAGGAPVEDTRTPDNLGASPRELSDFYRTGTYPMQDVYSVEGFLSRVGQVVNKNRPLVATDWAFELEHHPKNLPEWVRHGG